LSWTVIFRPLTQNLWLLHTLNAEDADVWIGRYWTLVAGQRLQTYKTGVWTQLKPLILTDMAPGRLSLTPIITYGLSYYTSFQISNVITTYVGYCLLYDSKMNINATIVKPEKYCIDT